MSSRPDTFDLESLCEQIFSGVYAVHGEQIINARKALLYSEATKALYAAGYDEAGIATEMSRLEEILKAHLEHAEQGAGQSAGDTTTTQHRSEPEPDSNREESPTKKTFRPESPPTSAPDQPPTRNGWQTIRATPGWTALALVSVLALLVWYEGYLKEKPAAETTIVVEYIFTRSEHPGFFPSRDGYEKVQAWCDTPEEQPIFFGLFSRMTPDQPKQGRITLKTAHKEEQYLWSCTRNAEFPYEKEYPKLLAAHWSWIKGDILHGANTFKPHYPCDIAIKSTPHYGKDELYQSDMRAIETWSAQEQDRLQDCIRGTRINLLAGIPPFLNDLFERETRKHTPPLMLPDVVAAYRTDKDIETLYQTLQGSVFTKETEQYAKNTRKWNQYVENRIKPARKQGRYWERKWDRESRKAQADKAFREQYGVGPDDYCQYEDRRGRTYRKRCSEAVKDPNWHDLGDGGFSRTMQSLGQMAQDLQRQTERNAARSYPIYPMAGSFGSLILTQNYATAGLYSAPAYSGEYGGTTSTPSPGKSCNETMDFGKFEPCFFPTPDCSLKTKGIFGSCRDYAKEKACLAEQKQKNTARQRERVADLKQRPECTKRAHCLEADLDGRKPDECKPTSGGKGK